MKPCNLIDHLEQLMLTYRQQNDEPLTSKDIHNLARAAKELAAAKKIRDDTPHDTPAKKNTKALSNKTLQLIEHDILGIQR